MFLKIQSYFLQLYTYTLISRNFNKKNFWKFREINSCCNFTKKISLRLPGAGTIKLDMASSLIELSVGGGGHTKLSIISTFRPLANAEMTGGSAKNYFLKN